MCVGQDKEMIIKYKDDGKTYLVFVEKIFLKTRICVMKTNEDERMGVVLEHNVTASTPKEIMRYWLSYRLGSWIRKLKRNVCRNGELYGRQEGRNLY